MRSIDARLCLMSPGALGRVDDLASLPVSERTVSATRARW